MKPDFFQHNRKKKKHGKYKVSLSVIMTGLVVFIVMAASGIALVMFVQLYSNTMEQNAITSSEQAVLQVKNTVSNYTEDMEEIMSMIRANIGAGEQMQNDFFQKLMEIRSDVVAITSYNQSGQLMSCWSAGNTLKEKYLKNLSYMEITENSDKLNISKPHVESLFKDYYPWVVTISQMMQDRSGESIQVSMDIRFSNIANYVDDVGIGQHGYCFIMDESGNIIYHPQQQLIYFGLKNEQTEMLHNLTDGSYTRSNVIYTLNTLDNSDWRIIGVSYVDEMITSKVESIVKILVILMAIVVVTAVISSIVLSRYFAKPANRLAVAMEDFEKNAENFHYEEVRGSSEIDSLSDSFGHMVLQVQGLMEKVRQEEISLRKTELNALQAQINPHFLYNTLDSIAWMCEEERSAEAVEMVNALARLFRISISRGHELITLEKELQHAESYLKIQKYRYKNQFTYTFKVEPECLHYLCNKITLQPIIENAIVHGLDMSDEGEIHITIKSQGEDILMTVEDNGIGMPPEQCKEILHREAGDRTGIGIKNVNDRIQIYFGEKYGLQISSEQDVGTRVVIRMPKIEEGSYDAK